MAATIPFASMATEVEAAQQHSLMQMETEFNGMSLQQAEKTTAATAEDFGA